MSAKESDIPYRTRREIASVTEPILGLTRGGKHFISILGTEVEKRPEKDEKSGTAYREEEFADFSRDDKSLEILEHLANAIKLNQPVLLEGKTDIGKTKAVEYLSFLTNTRLLRISISGQTDISELIGKFIPAPNRAGFDWADGVVTQAMTWNNGEGCWLYLDELGAAEPQILVKLNPVLEKQSRLTITEKEGEIITAGPQFRVIASTNPPGPGYAGRYPLARDLLRRFNYIRIGDLDEKTLYQRLSFIFRGETDAEKIAHVLAEFHIKANVLLRDMNVEQRQQFEFEYSDLVRLKEFVESSPEEDLGEALRSGISRYYCAKLLTKEQRGKIDGQLENTLADLHLVPGTKRKPRASKDPGVAFQIKQETSEVGIERTVQLIRGLIEELPEEIRGKIIPPLVQGGEKSKGKEDKEKKDEILIPIVILQGWRMDSIRSVDVGSLKLSEEELAERIRNWIGLGSVRKGEWFQRRVAQELGWLDSFHALSPDDIPYVCYSPTYLKRKTLQVPFEFVIKNINFLFGGAYSSDYYNKHPEELMLIACGGKMTWANKNNDSGIGWLRSKKATLGNLVAEYATKIVEETGELPLDLRVLLSAWEETPFVKAMIGKNGGLEGRTSKKGKDWEALECFINERKASGENIFASLCNQPI